jgi:hypothetical protein
MLPGTVVLIFAWSAPLVQLVLARCCLLSSRETSLAVKNDGFIAQSVENRRRAKLATYIFIRTALIQSDSVFPDFDPLAFDRQVISSILSALFMLDTGPLCN